MALDEIEENAIALISSRGVTGFLRDVASAAGAPKKFVVITSEPRPEAEEAAGYKAVANWLSKMGTQAYRVRTSGHYYPYQLQTILQVINPKEMIPIHTLDPEYLLSFCS